MRTQITLLITCMLFSKALSLTCQKCVSLTHELCNATEETCSDQCLTSTMSLYASGIKLDYNMKTCGEPDLCVSSSLNTGTFKYTTNSKCCSTNLCNTETLPAPPEQAPNGRMCYTCNGNNCRGTVNCTGNEDHCMSTTGDNTVPMKGCMSKSICNASESSTTNIQCCEGNLCNGAERFTLSFLLMLIPLLPSILFY